MNMKMCYLCKIEKSISEFSKGSKRQDKLHSCCKSCNSQNNSNWQKNNKQQKKKYHREKYANDPIYKLAKKLRSRLRQALLRQLTQKKMIKPKNYLVVLILNSKTI